jgi:hypothetical protein
MPSRPETKKNKVKVVKRSSKTAKQNENARVIATKTGKSSPSATKFIIKPTRSVVAPVVDGAADDQHRAYESLLGAEEVVAPSVRMDAVTGLPRRLDRPCAGYGDLLGILTGQKKVSVLSRVALYRLDSPPLKSSAAGSGGNRNNDCGRATVTDWPAWLSGLRAALAQKGVVVWRVPTKSVAFVFRKEHVDHAAALSLLMYPINEHKAQQVLGTYFTSPRVVDYAVGRLLGYNIRDIEALYLSRALEAVLMVNDYFDDDAAARAVDPDASMAKALAGAYSAIFARRSKEYDQELAAFLKSSEVTAIAANISKHSEPIEGSGGGGVLVNRN